MEEDLESRAEPEEQERRSHSWRCSEEFHSRAQVEESQQMFPWKVVEPFDGKTLLALTLITRSGHNFVQTLSCQEGHIHISHIGMHRYVIMSYARKELKEYLSSYLVNMRGVLSSFLGVDIC